MSYKLVSVKGNRIVQGGSLEDAIQAAKRMEQQLQPAFGVTICDEFDEPLAEVRDGVATRFDAAYDGEDEDEGDECAA